VLGKSVQSRADFSCCPKEISVGLNKYNGHDFLCKSPVCISSVKIANASTGTLEEVAEEEEVDSLRSCETQVRMMDVASCNNGFSATTARRHLSGGDCRGWTMAKDKLTENKKEMNGSSKFDRENGSSKASNGVASFGENRAVYKNGDKNIILQDHPEHVSSPVKYSVLSNSKVFIDSERVVSRCNESPLGIGKEKITGDNGDHGLDGTAKDSINVTFPKQAVGTDKRKLRNRLCSIYEDILVVDNIPLAEEVSKMLTTKYRHLIYACDTEVLIFPLFLLYYGYSFSLECI